MQATGFPIRMEFLGHMIRICRFYWLNMNYFSIIAMYKIFSDSVITKISFFIEDKNYKKQLSLTSTIRSIKEDAYFFFPI